MLNIYMFSWLLGKCGKWKESYYKPLTVKDKAELKVDYFVIAGMETMGKIRLKAFHFSSFVIFAFYVFECFSKPSFLFLLILVQFVLIASNLFVQVIAMLYFGSY